MRKRFVLWDFDGTLAHRPGQWSGALLETVARLEPGVVCELSQLRPHMQAGFPWHQPELAHEHLGDAEEWWAEIFPIMEKALSSIGLAPSRAAQVSREARHVYLDPSRWQVFDDAIPALQCLTAAGWSHAILSNHVPELSSLVRALGLGERFVGIYSSASLGFEKPHKMAFHRTLRELGDPEHVWMVGDSYNADIIGAEAVGIPGILVRSNDERARYCCATLDLVVPLITAE